MTSPSAAPAPARLSAPLALIGFVLNLFTPIVTVYWCIRARSEWIAMYPVEAARKPPTISRAISEPSIGDPFAFWVTTSAVVSLLGMSLIALLYARTIHATPMADAADRRRLRRAATGLVLTQLPLSIGMTMLSQFSLGATDDLHMAGSYVFFVSASLVQLLGILTSLSALALLRHDPSMAYRGLIHPLAAKLRLWAASITLATAIGYLALFIAKDTSLRTPTLYQAYVQTEVVLILFFSTFLLLHNIEFLRALIRRPGQSVATGQTPAPRVAGR
ncbi:MAG: hypothetical protein ACRBBU_04605 [Pseudooceanicola sp.]